MTAMYKDEMNEDVISDRVTNDRTYNDKDRFTATELAALRSDLLQGGDRIDQVIEYSEKQHDVESSDPVRGQRGQVELADLEVDFEDGAGELKGLASAQHGIAPGKMIRGQNAGRATAFGLKTVSPVPGADIDHRSRAHVDRIEDGRVFLLMNCRRLSPRCDNAVAEIDGVKPRRLPHALLECRRVEFHLR